MEGSERDYLIRKNGYWYRPNSQGYTSHIFDAGRYTFEQAFAISHPNGVDHPRDGMDFMTEEEAKTEFDQLAFEQESLSKREILTEFEMHRCPSCNARNILLAHSVRNMDARKHVECRICHMRGPVLFSNEDAVDAWNRLPRLSDDAF